MFSTDNLFFLVLLFIPATVFILYNRYIRATPVVERDETARLSAALLFGFSVFAINAWIFKSMFYNFVQQGIQNKSIFNDGELLFKVIVSNILTSILCCLIFVLIITPIFNKAKNCINTIRNHPHETDNGELWCDIFESNQFIDINDNCIVTIEKDNLKVSGFLRLYSSPTAENKAFLLQYTSEIADYFENDKKVEEDKKILSKVKYEYIDITNGHKIIFYDNTKYKEFQQK